MHQTFANIMTNIMDVHPDKCSFIYCKSYQWSVCFGCLEMLTELILVVVVDTNFI